MQGDWEARTTRLAVSGRAGRTEQNSAVHTAVRGQDPRSCATQPSRQPSRTLHKGPGNGRLWNRGREAWARSPRGDKGCLSLSAHDSPRSPHCVSHLAVSPQGTSEGAVSSRPTVTVSSASGCEQRQQEGRAWVTLQPLHLLHRRRQGLALFSSTPVTCPAAPATRGRARGGALRALARWFKNQWGDAPLWSTPVCLPWLEDEAQNRTAL